ncbi:MAG: SCP2 sterol-binding domain-containing protein [Candidatus Dormiibacterota bacterium]
MSVTADQLFLEELPKLFQPEKAGSTKATIQFDLSGEQSGQYHVAIDGGELSSGAGAAEGPDLTLIAAGEDLVKIFTGGLDPTAAFMSGKLKIKGNMGLALKLQSLFKRP